MNKRVAGRLVGLLALLASLAFLFLELRDGVGDISRESIDGALVLRWSGALCLYVVGLAGVHMAWGVAVSRAAEGAGILRPTLVSTRAQIAKYLPGNIAHIAGRQMLAVRHGWPQAGVMAASVVEVAGLASAGALIVGAGLAVGVRIHVEVPAWTWVVAAAIAAVALSGLVWLIWNRGSRLRSAARAAGRAAPALLGAYLAFLLLAGVGQWLLLQGTNFGTVVVAATAAWLVGFLSPGVPAGIGVREAVLAGALSVGSEDLAIGLLGFRAATILSDLVMFVLGSLWSAQLGDASDVRSSAAPQN